MAGHTPGEEFVRNLVRYQNTLYAYILTLLPEAEAARDVLQETSLELWSKWDEFAPGTDFLSWSCRMAYFKVLAYRRDRGRQRFLFSDELLEGLAAVGQEEARHGDCRLDALDDCLRRLPPLQRELILERYEPCGSVKDLAERKNRSAQGLAVTLHRIRRALMGCVEGKLRAQESR